MIVTDDHALVHRLSSPAHHVDKVYRVILDAPLRAGVAATRASGAPWCSTAKTGRVAPPS